MTDVWAIFEEHGEYSDYSAEVVAVVTGTEEEANELCERFFQQSFDEEYQRCKERGSIRLPEVYMHPKFGRMVRHWYDSPQFTAIHFDLVPATLLPDGQEQGG